MDLICKLFKFVLKIFKQIVKFVAEVIKILGEATVEVLTDLAEGIGSGISSLLGGPGILTLLLVGGLLWFAYSRDDADINVTAIPPMNNNA